MISFSISEDSHLIGWSSVAIWDMEKGSLTRVHTACLQEHREHVSAEVGSWSGCPKPFQGECQSTFSFSKSEAEHAAMHLLSAPNSEVGTQINVSAPPQPGECPPGNWFDVFALLFLWLHSPFLFLEHMGWFAGHFCKLMHGGHYAELHYFLDWPVLPASLSSCHLTLVAFGCLFLLGLPQSCPMPLPRAVHTVTAWLSLQWPHQPWCFVNPTACTKGWIVSRKSDGSHCTQRQTQCVHAEGHGLTLSSSLFGPGHINPSTGLGTPRSSSVVQNKSWFPSRGRFLGQPSSCTSPRNGVQLHTFYFSLFFFFPSDWHKLCLQLRFLRISSPRITMALINHLLPGLLIFSFLPCIFWLEFQSEVGTQTASKPQCTAHYPKKHCCNYRQAHSKSPHGGSSMHSPDQKQPCRKGHWVK